MKFLVDVCAGRRLASWLRDSGYDVQEVRDRAPDMEDDDILGTTRMQTCSATRKAESDGLDLAGAKGMGNHAYCTGKKIRNTHV